MQTGEGGHGAATLRDYLHVARRRKWIILLAVVLVPAAAIAFSLHEQKLYQAQAKVLLSAQNLAAQLTGTQNTGINEPQTEIVQTQAEVARVPAIAERVLRNVPAPGLTVASFLADSGVSASPNSDILTMEVTNHDPALAKRLVDEYAASYAVYRRKLDTSAIHNALVNVDGRIQQLVKAGGGHSSLYSSLIEHQQTLATMSALQTSNAEVVEYASKATLTQPKTSRNAILGIFLGIVLGVGLAFLWEALDTRVRSAQEIGERLGGLPMLGRLPVPGKPFRGTNRLVMLGDPSATDAEAFRMLRTSLEFATLGREARTIMVTSAVEQEGQVDDDREPRDRACALRPAGRARRPRPAPPLPCTSSSNSRGPGSRRSRSATSGWSRRSRRSSSPTTRCAGGGCRPRATATCGSSAQTERRAGTS